METPVELSIDTSTKYASAAISRRGEVYLQTVWKSEWNHSVEFAPALRNIMDQANITMNDVEAIFVAKGPGGFSALRVGISIAKALASARSIPLVSVETLLIEAWPYLGFGIPVNALAPAGRTKMYSATYDTQIEPNDLSEMHISVETIQSLTSKTRKRTIFCGEAVNSISSTLREYFGTDALLPGTTPPTRNPSILAKLAYEKLQESDIDDPEALQPLYINGSQVQSAKHSHTSIS